MSSFQSIRALALGLGGGLVALSGSLTAQTAPQPSTFTVFVRSMPVGNERIAVERTASGWTITGDGRVGPPVDLVIRKFEARYDADWKPIELTVDATFQGQTQTLRTSISGTSATNVLTLNGAPADRTDTVDPTSVLLPNPYVAPYQALAARLRTAAAGTTIPAYIPLGGSVSVRVGESTTEQIQTLERLIQARRTMITVEAPGGQAAQALEIWSDEQGRLLRLSVPGQGVDALREDIAAVSTRRVTSSRPNDEQVRVPANGFSLGGTISKPADAGARPLPCVVLVGGSGPTDRDELVFGIPIFGQIANALAEAGFLVLRYDKRGVGQSGGRPESATLADYAEDLRAVVRFMSERKDVDRRRIVVIGHSEGGLIGLLVAARENRVTALGLLGTPGMTGAEVNIYQVEHALDLAKAPADQRASTIELQKRIQAAVLTGKGWEDVPPNLRKQADTPWFQSFLAFDPAKPMRDADQPLLIVQGLLDTQVPPANADRLAALAKVRRNAGPVDVVTVPGVNHLLVPATTGEADEYRVLKDRNVSPAVIGAIVEWLKRVGSPAPRGDAPR